MKRTKSTAKVSVNFALWIFLSGCVPVKGKIFSFISSPEQMISSMNICIALKDIGFAGQKCQFSGDDSENWTYLPVFELVENRKIRVEIKCEVKTVRCELTFLEGNAKEFSKLAKQTLAAVESVVSRNNSNFSVSDLN